MKFTASILSVVAFTGVVFGQLIPSKCLVKMCTDAYTPMCASNGVTYTNICYFNMALCMDPTLTIVSKGPCPKKCDWICTKEYYPLCGSDGVTYGNKCMFEIAKCKNPALELVSEGVCPTKPPSDDCKYRLCTLEYAPVCASNGVTYGNKCEFVWAQKCDDPTLKILYSGVCKTKATLPPIYEDPTTLPTLSPI